MKIFQIDFLQMQNAVGSLQLGGCKDLPNGNVDIGDTIVKIGFPGRFADGGQLNRYIGLVPLSSSDIDSSPPVQRVNNRLLDFLVLLGVQRIHRHRLFEYRLE